MAIGPFIEQEDREQIGLSDLLDIHTRVICGKMHTGMVAQVRTFDAIKRTVDVQPVVRGRFQNGDDFKLPVLPGVPVKYLGGGGFEVTFPLAPGDFVWVSFAERSIDEWKSEGGADVLPQDLRRMHLSDGTAYPGVVPPGIATPVDATNMVIGDPTSTGMRITISPTGTIRIEGASAELLDLFDQTLTQIITLANSTVATALGPQPLSNGAAVATAVATIQTSLGTIKG